MELRLILRDRRWRCCWRFSARQASQSGGSQSHGANAAFATAGQPETQARPFLSGASVFTVSLFLRKVAEGTPKARIAFA